MHGDSHIWMTIVEQGLDIFTTSASPSPLSAHSTGLRVLLGLSRGGIVADTSSHMWVSAQGDRIAGPLRNDSVPPMNAM
jgi:hypothetical protein